MSKYEGTRIGDITLCADCGFAIQLRRVRLPLISLGGFDDVDLWEHFRIPVTPHAGVPKRAFTDFDYWAEQR